MASLKKHNKSGVLIVEAIVASFLMVFAFLASASLYEASLRWESQGANLRKAALVAERKMEEIRAMSANVPATQSFDDHVDALVAGQPAVVDGFDVTYTILPNHHEQVVTSGYTPTDGFHSPCSTLYTEPNNPTSTSRNMPPYNFDSGTPLDPAPRGAGDFQLNNLYDTYPYSRDMSQSYRLLKISVNYGARNGEPFDLISVIGDPVSPLADTSPNPNINNSMAVTPSGTQVINSTGFQDFSFTLTAANGSIVEDVSCLWNVHPLDPISVEIFNLDAKGSRVRVSHNQLTRSGTSGRLFPRIRYRGTDVRATSGDINL